MKDTFCVKCNTHLILTDNISNSPRIKCTNCNTSFNNPHYKKIVLEPKINSTNNEYKQILNFSEKNKSVIIKISIAVSLMFILGIYISRNNNRNDVTVPNYKYNSEENTTNNSYSDNKKTIKFNKRNGVLYIPIVIDGLAMEFIFDTGASSIFISKAEAIVLKKQGKLRAKDIIGTEMFQDANGYISEGTVVILREVNIGNFILTNVKATVNDNLDAPLLLGQSALKRFGKISIDYNKNEITFN